MTAHLPTSATGGSPRGRRDPRRPFTTSPFARLARTHAAGIAGDALFAVALAGSVFFNLDFTAARWRVALYLVLTIAPFAVAAPLIGPALDRIKGGRRWVILASMALRALLCFFIIRHLDSLLFYPEAFLMLVLGKAYTISKSAVVPTTVRSDTELVEANSKLTVISAVAVVVAVIPGGILLKLGGSAWALGLALVAFVAASALATQLPPTAVAQEPASETERMELRSLAIFDASIAMGLIRAVVGFLIFMLAFDFKKSDAPAWHLGVVAAAAQLGFFIGAVLAPRLRKLADEEKILAGNLLVTALAGIACAALGGLAGAALLSMVVGITSSAAKQAFDAIVQRDAPDANRGRSFARFETRFQLFWVVGALIPIVIWIPAAFGFLLVGVVTLGVFGWYLLGMWRARTGHVPARRRGVPGLSTRRERTPAPEPVPGPRPPAPDATIGSDLTTVLPAHPPQAGPDWEPPPGFVAHPLSEEPVGDTPADGPPPVVSDADTIVTEGPAGTVVQPPLPLGETVVYPEPPWRDTPGPEPDDDDPPAPPP